MLQRSSSLSVFRDIEWGTQWITKMIIQDIGDYKDNIRVLWASVASLGEEEISSIENDEPKMRFYRFYRS